MLASHLQGKYLRQVREIIFWLDAGLTNNSPTPGKKDDDQDKTPYKSTVFHMEIPHKNMILWYESTHLYVDN